MYFLNYNKSIHYIINFLSRLLFAMFYSIFIVIKITRVNFQVKNIASPELLDYNLHNHKDYITSLKKSMSYIFLDRKVVTFLQQIDEMDKKGTVVKIFLNKMKE